jgi:integrase
MSIREASPPGQYPTLPAGGDRCAPWACRESGPPEPPKPRLLDRVRQALRARHLSRRTEEAYGAWIRRFIVFHDKRHPAEMGAPEVTKFLTSLAVDGQVAASTQNQALSALLFLYKEVLEVDLPWLDGIVRAKRPARLPVVLTRTEVRGVLQRLDGVPHPMACLLNGAGFRVPGGPDVRPMTSPAASGGIRTGIRCTTAQPISIRQGCVARTANAWIRTPGSLEKGSGPDRYMRRGLAGVAVLRRSAYPVAEF